MLNIRLSFRALILRFYSQIFGRSLFASMNSVLLECAARGLGVNNPINLKMEIQQCMKIISNKPMAVVVDVGANIGEFAKMIKERKPNTKIYAFEPNPDIYNKLLISGEKYGFEAFQQACGHTVSRATLYDRIDNKSGTHGSLHEEVLTGGDKREIRQYSVDVNTIDSFFEEHDIKFIDFLKIDVEGGELDVLKGAKNCLENNKIGCIQFEFNEMNLVTKVFFYDFLNLLPGFDFYRIGSHSLIPIHRVSAPLFHELFAYQNILAIKSPV